MSVAWMLYASAVGVLLALATWLLDGTLGVRRGRTRVVCGTMLLMAVAWPLAVARLNRRPIPGQDDSGVIVPLGRGSPATSAPADPRRVLIPTVTLPIVGSSSQTVDAITARIAIGLSLLAATLLLVELVRVRRMRGRCQSQRLNGTAVLISPDFGPAVVGVLHPQIVMPRWVVELPEEQRRLLLAHESVHLMHHDSRWLALASLTAVIAPWNPGVWWLLRRLRLAMEVDCDRRVLSLGHDVGEYAGLLITIGGRVGRASPVAAGMATRGTMLRSRIERMTRPAGRGTTIRAVLGAALVGSACILAPSRADTQQSTGGREFPVRLIEVAPPEQNVPPAAVQAMLERLSPPQGLEPLLTVDFTRHNVRLGDSVDLVTVAWVPGLLKDKLRNQPQLRAPRLPDSLARTVRDNTTAIYTRLLGRTRYDRYVLWSTVIPTKSGRLETGAATLTYQPPVNPDGGFPPDIPALGSRGSQKIVKSGTAVLSVRR